MAEVSNETPADSERWYYCVRCARAWSTASWRELDWSCPSSAGSGWPEYHPHIGWSYVSHALGVAEPEEGGQYLLVLTGSPAARRA